MSVAIIESAEASDKVRTGCTPGSTMNFRPPSKDAASERFELPAVLDRRSQMSIGQMFSLGGGDRT